MPDPTPTPPPAPAPKVNRSTSNQDWINSLNNAGQIVAAAQKAENAQVLTTGVITAAKLTALATDIAAAHALAGDATSARATLEAAVKSIIARRREIQFAADAQWPASNPANAGIRREFRLSPDKAMK
jgi:ribosomal protein L17